MVKYSSQALDATFAALSDPTRRAILARLAQGDSSVTTLAEPFRWMGTCSYTWAQVLERLKSYAETGDRSPYFRG